MDGPADSVTTAPAPWTLDGQVAYLFIQAPRSVQDGFNENVDPVRSPYSGGYGGLLLVRYNDSPVGPYDELLLVPGSYTFRGVNYYRITQIYVSSMDSVVNGRRNWAVPKKLARFHWTDDNTSVKIYLPGQDAPFCSLRVRPRLYCFPASSAIVPASFRTFLQPALEGEHDPNSYFVIILSCSGWFRPLVQLLEFQTDGKELPSHEQLSLYTYGVGYEAFTLVFPRAEQIQC